MLLALLLIGAATLAMASASSVSPPAACRGQLRRRKEWGALTRRERKSYTDAVLCLQSKPSQLSHALYNTTSRYEDFVAVHMNSTRRVHSNGVFLAWHRGFINLFEGAHRVECGYAGALPYWDWIKYRENITASPLFDGSPFSLSGQGLPLSPEEKVLEPPCWTLGNVTCPKGPAGGCVIDGPFKNYRVGYLPGDASSFTNPEPGLPPTVFNYSPRCFSRDINQYIATNYMTQENLDNLLNTSTIKDFQYALDDVSGDRLPGLHMSGHFIMGPVGGDVFSAPAEPAFYLHHAMLDRVWAQWQNKDRHGRVYGNNALDGTLTTMNIPPSPNATLDTVINWGPLWKARALRELMDVGRGSLCYEYD